MYFCIFLHVLRSHSLLGDVNFIVPLCRKKQEGKQDRHSLNSNFGGYIRASINVSARYSLEKKQSFVFNLFGFKTGSSGVVRGICRR